MGNLLVELSTRLACGCDRCVLVVVSNVTDVLIKLQTDEDQELRDIRDGSSTPEQPSLNETDSIRDVNLRDDQGASY